METSTVKFELNAGKRGLFVTEGETPEIRNVKRKRRKSDGTVTPAQVVDHSFPATAAAAATPAAGTSTVKRSSRFRGVSRHRWTGRYEAHLWDKASWKIYLGTYDEEESAARAYDLAALKYWGATTITNFPVSDYENDIKMMQNATKEEYLASLRRKSSGFSRGVSKYRGVARHHHNGRWEARIGRVTGNKYLYLGTYSTQEEAAHAYDVAAIEYRGINAVTNFDLSTYIRWLRPEATTNTNSSCSHEPKPMTEFQAIQSSSTNIQSQESDSFLTDNLGSQLKQEYFQRDTLLSSCSKPSSPTALSLLFRSSIFRELLMKNLNTTNNEAENDEENGGIFNNNLYGNPYGFSKDGNLYGFSKENSRNSLDWQEQDESISLYDQCNSQCNSFGIMR